MHTQIGIFGKKISNLADLRRIGENVLFPGIAGEKNGTKWRKIAAQSI
jgi:hypothetical protein